MIHFIITCYFCYGEKRVKLFQYKTSSVLKVKYGYDYQNRDSVNKNKPKDATIIALRSDPYLDDLLVNQDSIVLVGEKSLKFDTHVKKRLLTDSTFEASVIPAQNAYVPVVGKMTEGVQSINFYSNKLGRDPNDSYYNYFIDVDWLPSVENTSHSSGYKMLSIQIGDVTSNRGFHRVGNKKLLYQYIYPTPDIISNGYLLYYTPEAFERVAKNHGILIQATDIDALNKNNRKSIIYSVLVGTGAALFFDILIQLIRELRNLNRRKDDEEAVKESLEEPTLDGENKRN